MDKTKEKAKIKRFYISFSVFWLLMVAVYFLGTQLTEGDETYEPILNIILVFFVILIPVIILISLPLFFAEGIMDRIKAKIDQCNEEK